MTLIRWSPLTISHDVLGIRGEVDRLFETAFQYGRRPSRPESNPVLVPPVDIEENAEEFVLRVDLPGVSQQDVKVSLLGDSLTIRAERKREDVTKNGSTHRLERAHGTFERTFTLGSPVRNDKVSARFKDGVLEVHVPRAEEARAREIEVQVA